MSINVTNTTQLNLFDTVKSILKSSSDLKKFKDNNYYEFEPNMKSFSFSQLPYIVINVPDVNTELLVMNQSGNIKEFTINIILVVAYDARSKYRGFANAIISSLEANVTDFAVLGYHDLKIDLDDTGVELIKDKEVVVGDFTLTLSGHITR